MGGAYVMSVELHERDSCLLQNRPQTAPSLFPPCEDTEKGVNYRPGRGALTTPCLCWHLDLGLPASRTEKSMSVV